MSTHHNLSRERRAEADSNRDPSAYHPNALPLGQPAHGISQCGCSIVTTNMLMTLNSQYSYHKHADDTQLEKSEPPSELPTVPGNMDVGIWSVKNRTLCNMGVYLVS